MVNADPMKNNLDGAFWPLERREFWTRHYDANHRGLLFAHKTGFPQEDSFNNSIVWCDIFQNHMNYRYLSVFFNVQWAILMSIPMSYIAAIAWVTFDEQSKPLRSNETDAGTGFTKSQTEGHPNQDPSLGERTMAATEIITSFVTLAVTVEASPSKWHELFLSKPKMIWLIEHVAAELEVPVFLLRRSEEVGIVRRATVQSSESARKGMGWEGVAFWFFYPDACEWNGLRSCTPDAMTCM